MTKSMYETSIGKTFSSLQVTKLVRDEENRVCFECKCLKCGKSTIKLANNVVHGITKSCGCSVSTFSGLRKHPLYSIWYNINNRCYNKKTQGYDLYGRKGITVCEAWRNNSTRDQSFRNFIKWADKHDWKPGKILQRIDNAKEFSPKNCQFVDKKARKKISRKIIDMESYANILNSSTGKQLVDNLNKCNLHEVGQVVRRLFLK